MTTHNYKGPLLTSPKCPCLPTRPCLFTSWSVVPLSDFTFKQAVFSPFETKLSAFLHGMGSYLDGGIFHGKDDNQPREENISPLLAALRKILKQPPEEVQILEPFFEP